MEKECTQITMVGVYSNVGLALFKFVAGVTGNSMAMIADAVHSLSDLVTDGITLWAARLTHKPQDAGHPYGHGKFEAIGSLSISVTLAVTAGGIGWSAVESIQNIISGQSLAVPTGIALVAAVVSIAVKEVLYHSTLRVGNKWNSKVIKANAWHHRSDSISTLVAMIGVVGAMIQLPVLDPVAGLFVSGLILKAALELGWDSLRDLTDENVDERVLRAVGAVLTDMRSEGVLGFHRLRGRAMGPFILMDVHISVDPTISVSAAHQIAERARIRVRQRLPVVSEFLVHVELGEVRQGTVFEDLLGDAGNPLDDSKTQTQTAEPQMLTEQHVAEVLREYDDKQAAKQALSSMPIGDANSASAVGHAAAGASTSASAASAAAAHASSRIKSTLQSMLNHTSGPAPDASSSANDASSSCSEDQGGEGSSDPSGPAHLDLSRLMRPQSQIERDVRRVLSDPHCSFAPHLLGVSHFTCHWLNSQLHIQLELAFRPSLTIAQAQDEARDIEATIRQQVSDVSHVDVHLELTPAHILNTQRIRQRCRADPPHHHEPQPAAAADGHPSASHGSSVPAHPT